MHVPFKMRSEILRQRAQSNVHFGLTLNSGKLCYNQESKPFLINSVLVSDPDCASQDYFALMLRPHLAIKSKSLQFPSTSWSNEIDTFFVEYWKLR